MAQTQTKPEAIPQQWLRNVLKILNIWLLIISLITMLPDKVVSLGIPGKEKGRREKLEGKKKDINTHY